MDGIADILSRKDFDMPPEVLAIKEYVRRHYDAEVTVTMGKRDIVVSAHSAALIGTLRLNSAKLQAEAHTDKQIRFRSGS